MSKTKSLTIEQIKEAYETHGKDFLIIDIFPTIIKGKLESKLRTNKNETVQYGDVLIKKADGEYVPLVIDFRQVSTFGRIKEPEYREYESIKIHLKKNDLLNSESKFGEIIDIICKTFEEKCENLVKDNKISTKPKNNKILKVHSTEFKTPMQYTASKDGEIVELDNPSIWITFKTKNYTSEELSKLEQYNDLTYKGDDKPILIKDFDISIYDLNLIEKIEKPIINKETGEKLIVKKSIVQLAKDKNGNFINNCNIHNFITKGSIISGKIEMGIVISKGQFHLKTTFKDKLYVYPNINDESNENQELDEEYVDDMIPNNSLLILKNQKIETDNETEIELDDTDELTLKFNSIDNE